MYDYDLYTASLRSGPDCPAFVKAVTTYIEEAISGNLTQADKDYVYQVF